MINWLNGFTVDGEKVDDEKMPKMKFENEIQKWNNSKMINIKSVKQCLLVYISFTVYYLVIILRNFSYAPIQFKHLRYHYSIILMIGKFSF